MRLTVSKALALALLAALWPRKKWGRTPFPQK